MTQPGASPPACFFVFSMKNEKNIEKTAWWQPALVMFGKLSAWIVAPVLVGAFVGNWLDKEYGTEPWLFLTATGFSFLISMVGLIIETKKEIRRIERENKKDKF